MLSHAQTQQFKIDGYLVLQNVLCDTTIHSLRETVSKHLSQRIEPFELEAQVQYPGSPTSIDSIGGGTIRRLLQAYHRDRAFQDLAQKSQVTQAIKAILQTETLYLNPNHHNCIMTKQAKYSSATLWHRDTRYWHFNTKYLINAWFALGQEHEENGGMKILPGSHRWEVQTNALDEAQFLLLEHPDNHARLATQREVNLNSGDVLLFSAHCFHAAGKNHTQNTKYSAVFTYHDARVQAIANSKSDTLPAIAL